MVFDSPDGTEKIRITVPFSEAVATFVPVLSRATAAKRKLMIQLTYKLYNIYIYYIIRYNLYL